MYWFWITPLSDWSRKLVLSSQPVTYKTQIKRNLVICVSPRFSQLARFYSEFWLALKGIFLRSDWSLRSLCLCFCDSQLRNALKEIVSRYNVTKIFPAKFSYVLNCSLLEFTRVTLRTQYFIFIDISDIDECAETAKCKGKHTICSNTVGSFLCRCGAGFIFDEFDTKSDDKCKGLCFYRSWFLTFV